MMEVTSGDYVKETNLLGNDYMLPIKETSLVDWDEGVYLSNMNSACIKSDEIFSNVRMLREECDVSFERKENNLATKLPTHVIFAGYDRPAGLLRRTFFDDVKETDICDDIALDTDMNYVADVTDELKETDLLENEEENGVSLLKQSRKNTDLLADNDAIIYNDDIDDGENKFDEKMVTFQDIDTDYFETDCELDDEKPTITNLTGKSITESRHVAIECFEEGMEKDLKNKTKSGLDNTKYPENGDIITTSDQSRTSILSNTLLRSSINELEKALAESNLLLTKRDKKLQQLRGVNSDLKKSLNEEVERRRSLEKRLLQKEALLTEREMKIMELQKDMDLNEELKKVPLNTANNSYLINNVVSKNEVHNIMQFEHNAEEADALPGVNRKKSLNHENRFHEPTCQLRKPSKHISEGAGQDCNPKNKTNICSYSDEKLSKSELHSNLKMRFMRDAFFHYMIGFHPDEQINAILAILDYGDKRQDFVLEAHNMKKLGKKFCATKVSSRGLTFVQEKFKE